MLLVLQQHHFQCVLEVMSSYRQHLGHALVIGKKLYMLPQRISMVMVHARNDITTLPVM